jgi:Na+/H+-dicarboxylate symporter
MLKLKLHWKILIAMILGVIIGFIYHEIYHGNPDGTIYNIIIALGEIFIRLLRMVIVPLIFTSIVSGVASVGSGKGIGRLGLKTFSYYIITSLLAIMVGLVLTNVLRPGVGANIAVSSEFSAKTMPKSGSPAEILIRMIPVNPLEAMATGDMLGIIFFAIFLGWGITKIKPESSEMLKKFFDAAFDAIMKVTEAVIQLVPLGVLGLIVKAVATAPNEIYKLFGDMALYMATIAAGLAFHLVVTLPLIFFLFTRINPVLHFRAMASAMITAFSTSSSNATLPVTMQCVEQNAGVSNRISSFVLPMGATVNMDGTALYECAGVIFISQVLGLDLSIAQQFIIVLTALLASIGCAGIPSAGLVVIFIVTQAVGFKDEQVAVIIGTMLAVDRPLDMFRTMVNVFSDSVGTAIVAKSEGETNLYQAVINKTSPDQ